MPSQIVPFVRSVNGISIEQRRTDGFINATAMAVAHGKKIDAWFRTAETLDLFIYQACLDCLNVNHSDLSDSCPSRLSATKYAKLFPGLITVKRGSPSNGGGTWIHPDLAVQCAQWCNTPFALQVSRWVREWFTTAHNPLSEYIDVDQEIAQWMQRHDMRIFLKDVLRPELMALTVAHALETGENPRVLCRQVHDTMNERIQGAKSHDIKTFGHLPMAALLRDHLGVEDLVLYNAVNRMAKNAMEDRGLHPVSAVHHACDNYLGRKYIPKLAHLQENVYLQGQRLKLKKRRKQLQTTGIQMTLFDENN